MRFTFSTASLHTYGLDRCFELARQTGFDGMEVMADQRWDTRQPDYLRRLSARYALPVLVIHTPLAFFTVPGWPEDEVGRLRETVRLAQAVGAGVVVHHLPWRVGVHWLRLGTMRLPLPGPSQNAYRRWLLEEYPSLQTSTPVTLCIENMPALARWGRRWNLYYWNTPAEIIRFPNLTMDTTHLGTWGLEPAEVYAQLGDRVRHVHLSNFDGKEHRRPETGRLHLDRLLAHLATTGYPGTVSLELSPDALDAGQSDERVLALLSASLNYCRARARPPTTSPATASPQGDRPEEAASH